MRPLSGFVALCLVVVACGGEDSSRLDLRTPGTQTGAPAAPTLKATPESTVAPTPTPTPAGKPVTRAEKRVIKGWSDELRHGRVAAASRYFSVPSRISNVAPGWEFLETKAEVEAFNRGLPCGAKLLRTRRSVDGFVVGIFRLTERPGIGDCGTGTGALAAVAFSIRDDHITQWVRADASVEEPTPSPTPVATSDPDSA